VTGSDGEDDGVRVGDRVRVAGECDHPEDPVGTVVSALAAGGLLVVFPLAGAEVHAPSDLRRVGA
jgi:hypothetical protein